MKLIILSEQKSFLKKGASNDCIIGQEKAFIKKGKERVKVEYKSLILKNINRILKKIGVNLLCDSFTKVKQDDAVHMYIAMNLNYLVDNAYLLKNLKRYGNKIALYIYDCWEPEFDDWQKVIDDIAPNYIFFCFKQTYEHYKDRYNCFWIPQSADLDIFKPLEVEKGRRFIQMGRVNEVIHKRILEYLKNHNMADDETNYIYRRSKKEQIFPELSDLVRGINESKYIVCVPKCFENFKRTGNVCGITARYFEAMACKTLIIGRKPTSFDELFPYEAMIDLGEEASDFDSKIDKYENNDALYKEIVERNYEYLLSHHTWGHRLEEILRIIG